MSKSSEQRALEAYPVKMVSGPIGLEEPKFDFNSLFRCVFQDGYEQAEKDLAMSSPLPEDTVLFQKGVEEGKRLIMEDAVDGEIGYWNQSGLSIRLDQSLEKLGYDMDTKVKIIIVKEDDGLHKAEAE